MPNRIVRAMFIRRKLQFMILEFVKEKGKATSREIYEVVRKIYDISYQQFLSILMQLEIEGFIEIHQVRDNSIVVLKTRQRMAIE